MFLFVNNIIFLNIISFVQFYCLVNNIDASIFFFTFLIICFIIIELIKTF